MILGLCLITATVVICTMAATSSRAPRGPHTPRPAREPRVARAVRPARAARPPLGASRRELERRAARLPIHPELARPLDVEFLLAQVLDPATAGRCLDAAADCGTSAPVMWRFAHRFGVDKLVLAVDAQTSERTMLWHLDGGTVPDWGPMSLFAAMNGEQPEAAVPLGEVIEIDVVPKPRDATPLTPVQPLVQEPVDLGQFDDLPPITGPGETDVLRVTSPERATRRATGARRRSSSRRRGRGRTRCRRAAVRRPWSRPRR